MAIRIKILQSNRALNLHSASWSSLRHLVINFVHVNLKQTFNLFTHGHSGDILSSVAATSTEGMIF